MGADWAMVQLRDTPEPWRAAESMHRIADSVPCSPGPTSIPTQHPRVRAVRQALCQLSPELHGAHFTKVPSSG